ncbi:hypothetical protein EOL70_14330 [Leucothrix sargassi]|nr:hypothetical protein EOL70_14330 [Leucothrix sargassi]
MFKFLIFLLLMTTVFLFTASYRTAGDSETQWLLKTSPSLEKNIGSNDAAKYQSQLSSGEIPNWVLEKDYQVLSTFKDLGSEGHTIKDHGMRSLVLILDLFVLIGWPIYFASWIIIVFRKLMTKLFNRKR